MRSAKYREGAMKRSTSRQRSASASQVFLPVGLGKAIEKVVFALESADDGHIQLPLDLTSHAEKEGI